GRRPLARSPPHRGGAALRRTPFWRCPVSDGQCQDSLGASSTSHPGISHRSARPNAPDTCGRKRQPTIGSSAVRTERWWCMRLCVTDADILEILTVGRLCYRALCSGLLEADALLFNHFVILTETCMCEVY